MALDLLSLNYGNNTDTLTKLFNDIKMYAIDQLF